MPQWFWMSWYSPWWLNRSAYRCKLSMLTAIYSIKRSIIHGFLWQIQYPSGQNSIFSNKIKKFSSTSLYLRPLSMSCSAEKNCLPEIFAENICWEITKWAEIFTGWFYSISLDSDKIWKHLMTLYQCCAWALTNQFFSELITTQKIEFLHGVLAKSLLILFTMQSYIHVPVHAYVQVLTLTTPCPSRSTTLFCLILVD